MAMVSPLILGVAGAGLLLVWSAVHGANVTDSLRDLLAGRSPVPPDVDPAAVSATGGQLVGSVAGAAASSSTSSANKANGQLQAAAYGWTGEQWTALDKLWTRESGWNNTAQNPTSSAYGIAQFLDSTWAKYGPKTADPTLQIRYGLAYIRDRYGSPSAAWAHETAQGWY
jgi:hypothetical protein